jgi:uncharacterized protein (TIGR03546 family)
MFWLTLVKNFFQILRSGQTPAQIAGGFALGAIVGLMPVFTLQGLALWLVIFLLNVNLTAVFLSATIFTLIAYLFDPIFHALGYFFLVDVSVLRSLWTSLYNAPLAPLTRFNNTIVLGSLLAAVVFFLPIYFAAKRFVIAYRAHIGARVERWKIVQIISKSAPVQWYNKIKDLGS